jgi:hypothetical protein
VRKKSRILTEFVSLKNARTVLSDYGVPFKDKKTRYSVNTLKLNLGNSQEKQAVCEMRKFFQPTGG